MPLVTDDWQAGTLIEASWVRADAASFPRHTHDEYVLGTNLKGTEHIWLDGRTLTARPGEITLYNPLAMQASEFCPTGVEYVSLHLDPEGIARVVRDNNLASSTFEQGVFSHPGLHQALLDFARTPAAHRRQREEAFLCLLCQWLEPRNTRFGEQHAAVSRAVEYLRDCLTRKADLDDLAAAVGLSKYHLVRCFKKQIGLAPLQYQMQLRLIESRRRLRDRASVLDVATELGFYDQSHFINAFRKVMGVSPQAYSDAYRDSPRMPRKGPRR
ncbi:helix-turn-helix transcriptional regulator [Pseudomonas asplenii]|uniref:Transcriptional regulator, AraC family n=1 Tax=Pseudomonas asplenii TaxID=53407 RepID=A0A0N0E545_9PSED|nr:AraC family transcriptional regulator [Pseudomonas fuscovaginae]KPA92064.1 transcriptional regulator, AraC family [Pseudomonas fuscovaginae]KPA99394.1 transcriptional regulator, AraC family [Pseudomonas fuscovaginae]